MTIAAYPFHNQDVTQTQYSLLMREFQDSGVVGGASGPGFTVSTDGSGMDVQVQQGFAILRGHAVDSNAVESVLLDPSSSSPRIDRLVLRLDPGNARISLEVLKGTPGSNPTPTEVTQTAVGIFEIPLADITVPAGAVNIVSGNITDRRRFTGNRVGTWGTSSRPSSPRPGQLGYNVTTSGWEFWSGGQWIALTDLYLPKDARAADSSLLNGKTNSTSATANTVAERTTNGRLIVGTPSGTSDATTKAYVDSGLDGKLGSTAKAVDSAKLNGRSESASADASTIALRGTNGRLVVGTPAGTTDATTKGYVDSGLNSKLDSSAKASDSSLLNGKTNSTAATAGTVAERTTSGRLAVGTPSGTSDATTKAYVDSGLGGKADASHEHDGYARIASGAYLGNGANNRSIALPFVPKVVIVSSDETTNRYWGVSGTTASLTSWGFRSFEATSGTANTATQRPQLSSGLSFIVSGGTGSPNDSGKYYDYVAIG